METALNVCTFLKGIKQGVQKTKIDTPAVEGFFTQGKEPCLIGGRYRESGGYCFPKNLGGSDPDFPDDEIEEVTLSRFGKIWSYTNSTYPPPPPFIAAEPYEPIVIAAVELEKKNGCVRSSRRWIQR